MKNHVGPVALILGCTHLFVQVALDTTLFSISSRLTGELVASGLFYWLWRYIQFQTKSISDPVQRENEEYTVWTLLKVTTGVLLTINFVIFWMLPIGLQGQFWKLVLHYPLRPIYLWLDNHPAIREFAVKHVYRREPYSDYFVQQIMVGASSIACFAYVLFWQLSYGSLPFWLIIAYYFAWVGFGGRVMGGAYTFAHREAHNNYLYKEPIRQRFGNIFENWLGNLFGNVPYNFTTSHIAIHHKLQAGMGDTFYQWDFDRSSWTDFMIFLQRILSHMSGWSSLMYFKKFDMPKYYHLLLKGMAIYWFIFPSALLLITRSPAFLYYIWLQPLFCMTYFIAFMNFAYHGFLEFDESGRHVWCVDSTAIIEGDDDYFGEDDHMAHHYATAVWHRDLEKYREGKIEEIRNWKGSVFRKLSIVELALFILIKDWGKLADHYVDYTGKMKREEVMKMLEVRAKRKDMTNQEYIKWQRRQEEEFAKKRKERGKVQAMNEEEGGEK